MRKPIEKAAKVLLRIQKSKRCVQTTSTRDQSVAVQSSHPAQGHRAMPTPTNPPPRPSPPPPVTVTVTECPFKARQQTQSQSQTPTTTPSFHHIPPASVPHEPSHERKMAPLEESRVQGGSEDVGTTSSSLEQFNKIVEEDRVVSKPYSQIPTARGLPLVGTLFDFIRAGGASQLHEFSLMRHTQLGPIFKENLGGTDVLFVSDPPLFKDVTRFEGNTPASLKPASFHLYNKVNPTNGLTGLFIMEGEEWWTHRKQSNITMLTKPPEMNPGMMLAYEDFVTSTLKRWEVIVENNSGKLVSAEKEIARLGFEGLSRVLFGRRYGPNWAKMDTDMNKTIKYSHDVVEGMRKLSMIPPTLARKFNSRIWTDFDTSMNQILGETKELTALCLDDVNTYKPEEGFEQGGLLYKIATETDFNRQSLIEVITGLASPVDPPSTTMTWILWTLGRYPEVQEKIYQEVQNVVGPGKTCLSSHLTDLSYVKMVMKEILRLKPTTTFVARVLPTDGVIGGYEINAGQVVTLSIYATHRNPKYFPDPSRFWPERWARPGREDAISATKGYTSLAGVTDPIAYIPFGMGKRSCIGRVVARSMLNLVIARFVQNFKIESEHVGTKMNALLLPDRPLQFKLTKREDAP